MSTRVNKYRCYCASENSYVYAWGETPPAVCPNNNTHVINTDLTTVIETVSSTNVFVSKDTNGAGKGYYMFEGDKMDIVHGPNTMDKIFPFDIRIFGFQFFAAADNHKDKLDVIIAPDTIVGVLVANADIGATTFYVSPTVIQYMDIGHHLKLSNGVDVVNDCGLVIAKDAVASTITVRTPTTHAFTGMVTYVMLNIYIVKNLHIMGTGTYNIGYGTGDSKIIPANTTIRIMYTCTDVNAAAREFGFQYEYTY